MELLKKKPAQLGRSASLSGITYFWRLRKEMGRGGGGREVERRKVEWRGEERGG